MSDTTSIAGRYFPQGAPTPRDAILYLRLRTSLYLDDNPAAIGQLDDVEIDNRLGNLPRTLRFSDGSAFQTSDHETLERWFKVAGIQSSGTWLHQLESRWLVVTIALVLSVASLAGAFVVGIPWLATRIAFSVDAETLTSMWSTTVSEIDERVFKASDVPTERQTRLVERLAAALETDEMDVAYGIEFRRGPANAFAFPDGTIVIFDGIVALAEDDTEVLAVLLHEVGHVRGRHALRHILQSSIGSLIIISITGDASAITGAAALSPAVLTELHYSRAFELEADAFAAEILQKRLGTARPMIEMLRKLADTAGGDEIPSFLSTHPDATERIERLERLF